MDGCYIAWYSSHVGHNDRFRLADNSVAIVDADMVLCPLGLTGDQIDGEVLCR